MKKSLVFFIATVVFVLGVLFVYRSQINTVILCSQAEDILLQTRKIEGGAAKQTYLAERISGVIYTAELKRLFAALATVSPEMRSVVLKEGLNEIMGGNYECPPLQSLLGGP